mgnify:CR=1 FL=1
MVSKSSCIKSVGCADRGLSAEYWLRTRRWISYNELKVQFAKRKLLMKYQNIKSQARCQPFGSSEYFTLKEDSSWRHVYNIGFWMCFTNMYSVLCFMCLCVLQTCTQTWIFVFSTVSNIYSCCVRAFVSNAWQWTCRYSNATTFYDNIGSARYLADPGMKWNHTQVVFTLIRREIVWPEPMFSSIVSLFVNVVYLNFRQ